MSKEITPNPPPPGVRLRHTLKAHRMAVNHVAWAPDGRALASASQDGTVRVWDVESGQSRTILSMSSARVYSVSWSSRYPLLACGTSSSEVLLCNTAGEETILLQGHEGNVYAVSFSPDGAILATGGRDGAVLLWDVERLSTVQQLRGHGDQVNALAWSPDGGRLASCSDDGDIRLWAVSTGKRLARTKVKKTELPRLTPVTCLAWMPGGQLLASGTIYGGIKLWDSADLRQVNTLEGHTKWITDISFSAGGELLASKSQDDSVRLWRCDTWETVSSIEEKSSEAAFAGLAFHPAGPILATPGQDNAIRIWDLDVDVVFNAGSRPESVFYTTAKIALVGDSGVGKTGLGWRLAHGEFKEHPSTHGQQFWVVNELGATRGDETQCEAVLWDLAGQPDYRLVHALFLDDVDVALVLFDPANRQEPLKGAEYWLKQLSRERRDGRRRRVILVGARADRGAPTLTREELEEFCKLRGAEGGYLSTSALTGEGLPELLERVRASIAWDEIPATVTTRTFKRVKEFVLGLKEEAGRKGVLVSPAELRGRLEATDAAWEFTDDEMMTAVRHLSNHGYVSVLRGSSGEETILLAPDLLANLAASFVLEARRNPRGLGALDEARALQGGYEFPELAGLDERERDVLLDAAVVLFIEHNLCFRETLGAETFLIFPALINQKRPLLEEVETVEDVSYRVTGAVENVYAAVVVQLGYTRNFTRTNQWQDQAEYETARGDVCGFRQTEEREGGIELVLYHAKERAGARLLFQGLFEEFLRGRDVTVTKFPPVACHVCGYRQQRAEVVKRIGEGKGFLFCGECGGKIALPKEGEKVMLSRAERGQLVEEQERARRRTEFESALVRVKAVARDERLAAPSCFLSYAWGEGGQERWVRGLARDLENAGVAVTLDQKDNPEMGRDVARFISRIEQSDFVVVVGTPLYRRKYENRVSATGSIVAAEVNLINLRLTGTNEEAETVLPLLLEGSDRESLPPLLRGRVYGNFLDERLYFASLFDLILTLYRIRFDHPAVSDLREALRSGRGRRR